MIRTFLLYIIDKLGAALEPEYGVMLRAYQREKQQNEIKARGQLQAIADAQTQIAIGESQLATDTEQVKGNEDAIKTLELQRGEVADAARTVDAAIDVHGAGDIDRPLPGTGSRRTGGLA